MPTFDANGTLIGLDTDTQDSTTDGVSNARNQAVVLYNGGGPATSIGIPSNMNFDRQRSLQGKAAQVQTITATVAGDMAITCPAGTMKTIMPGQFVKLSLATGEAAYVSLAYIPSATATSIPLQQALVQTGNTQATWDAFSVNGPQLAIITPSGVPLSAMVVVDATQSPLLRGLQNAANDTLSSFNTLAVASVGYNGNSVSERVRSPNVYKVFTAQAVTASSANTPTSLWTPTTGLRFRLMGYWFSTSAAAGIVLHDLAAQGGTGLLPLSSPIAAAAGILQSPPIGNGYLSTTPDNQLWVDATIATTLTGFAWGTQE